MTRPSTMPNRRNIRGGLFHLAAEIAALAALLGVTAVIAWLMLVL